MDALQWVQDSGLGIWMRESSWALFAALIVHTAAMGFLVGTGFVINLRVLGVARGVAMGMLPRLFPVMWTAFGVALFSGIFLLIAYPAKALTTPTFYIKMALILSAALLMRALARRVLANGVDPAPGWAKAVAVAGMLCWAGALLAGKLLEYTHHILLVY